LDFSANRAAKSLKTMRLWRFQILLPHTAALSEKGSSGAAAYDQERIRSRVSRRSKEGAVQVEDDLEVEFLTLRFLQLNVGDHDFSIHRRGLRLVRWLIENSPREQIDHLTLLRPKVNDPSGDLSRGQLRFPIPFSPHVEHDLAKHIEECRLRLHALGVCDEFRFELSLRDGQATARAVVVRVFGLVASGREAAGQVKNSDKQNAKIEHDKALLRAVTSLLKDDTQFFKQFSDNDSFRRWVTDTVFSLTYR
jgi:hypothetical protein